MIALDFNGFMFLVTIHKLHIPSPNGIAKKKNIHVIETSLVMMMRLGIPMVYGNYCFKTIVYLINRLPSKTLKLKSPFELLCQTKQDYIYTFKGV